MITVLTDIQTRDNIAGNLQRILAERGISQTQLARMTGDPITSITRVYHGRNEPGVGIVARIAEALDVSQDRLTGPAPEKFSVKSA